MGRSAESDAAERLRLGLAAAEQALERERMDAAALEKRLAYERERRRELEAALAGVTTSAMWRLAQRLWALRIRIAPPGTRRDAFVRRWLERSVPPVAEPVPIVVAPAAAEAPTPVAEPVPLAPPSPPMITQAARLLTPRAFRVLFVSPDARFVSHRYRVLHYAQYLERAGVETRIVELPAVDQTLPLVPLHDVVVVFRLAAGGRVDALYAACRRAGVPIVYDVDDIVFDPDVITPAHVDSLRDLPAADLAAYLDAVPCYRDALTRADFCFVPTEALAVRCRAFGVETFVLPNGLSDAALAAPTPCSPPGDEVVLGYFSGTRTHQRDFAVVVPALVRILDEFRHVRLVVTGELTLGEFAALERFHARVTLRPRVAWEALQQAIAAVHVNLAPLEIGNPFCEAKSELKYFDAAIVGVPTVASATRVFADAVRDGVTGFLARTDDDWYAALAHLVMDPALRARVGAAARADVVARYAPAALAPAARATYATLLETQRARAGYARSALAVTVVIDPYRRDAPGAGRILALANALGARGHEVRLVVDGPEDVTAVSFGWLRDDGHLRAVRFGGSTRDLVCSDVLMATSGATAATVGAHRRLARHAVELALGDRRREATDLPIVAWGRAGDLSPAVDRALYTGTPERAGRDWVLCLIRPGDPCRTNALALAAMAELARRDQLGSAELVLFGDGYGGRTDLAFPHTDLGRRPIGELPPLYRRASVGIVLHDGYDSPIGLEMTACGCPVVDLDTPAAVARYGGRDNALLVAPSAGAIADAVTRLLRDAGHARAIAAAGQRHVQSLPGIDDVAAQLEGLLVTALA